MVKGRVISATYSIYTQNYIDEHRVTIVVRSWQHRKSEGQVGSWGVVKPSKLGYLGGAWSA